MACHSAVAKRREWAFQQLLAGRSTTSLVAEIADSEGCSRRTAREAVKFAYDQLVQDVEGSEVQKVAMIAKLGHLLEASLQQAVARNNHGAVSSLAARLMELYSLVPPATAGRGSYGRSRM